jgi:hypothetical protein
VFAISQPCPSAARMKSLQSNYCLPRNASLCPDQRLQVASCQLLEKKKMFEGLASFIAIGAGLCGPLVLRLISDMERGSNLTISIIKCQSQIQR